jgi:DNA-binding phage protein
MNEIRLIDEGNDEDFGVAEYDFGARSQSARAAALQAKLRAEAQARLAKGASREEMIEASLKESADYAATYLRDALADDDPRAVLTALQQVARTRGGIADLNLSVEERANLANALAAGFAAQPIRQAA